MQIDDAQRELNIIRDFIPAGKSNRPGSRLNATLITIHNTDNPSAGANARAHARYLKGEDARKRKVSWHYTVDDTSVVQSLPDNEVGWHAATGAGNSSSLGIEICMNSDLNEAAAYDRAALLVAVLGREHGVLIPSGVVQHNHWSGKNCPSVLRAKPNGWNAFLSRCKALSDSLTDMQSASIQLMHDTSTLGLEVAGAAAMASSSSDDPLQTAVPFAQSSGRSQTRHWPVITTSPQALMVCYRDTAKKEIGPRPGRRFLANRSGGLRYHVGVDLFAYEGDDVVAIEDGKIVAFLPFYAAHNGEMTYALFVAHAGYVANYGEVKERSPQIFGWKAGDAVRPGQRIARVSATGMIHFETYLPGTKRNARWMQNEQSPPAALRDPTALLLDLARNGIRVTDPGAESIIEAAALAPAQPTTPAPTASEWHSKFGGREWRYDDRGVWTRDSEQEMLWRTQGAPATCRDMFRWYGDLILASAAKHGVNPALIMMTIATETAFIAASKFTGPQSFRWEAAVENTDVTPPFLGAYSAGPMQTLSTTARELIQNKGQAWNLNYQPFIVAPAIKSKPKPAPKTHPLYEAAANLDIGTGEIRMRLSKTGDDPILVAAAFNTGGVRKDAESKWGIHAQGDHLDRAARWYGDACQVLVEEGVF